MTFWLSVKLGRNLHPYRFVSDSNAIMAVFTSICSFMVFKDLKIKCNKLINTIGASTFGVLLIHANSDTMRQWLWRDTLDNIGHYADELFWLRPIILACVIFAVCIVIDIMRIRLVEQPVMKIIDDSFETTNNKNE